MRLCSDCDRVIYLVLSLIFLFLSNSCMFSVVVYCFGQVVGSDSKRERCARLWAHASLMTRLSDRNMRDRKSTRLNSSHGYISYAVFCLKKTKNTISSPRHTRDVGDVTYHNQTRPHH